MDAPTPGLRPPRRYRNRSASVAKIELRIEPGEELELPEGSVIELDRAPLSVIEPVEKAPAKKTPRKGTAKS